MTYIRNFRASSGNRAIISGSNVQVTGSLFGSVISGTTAQFTTISGSVISASQYVGPINATPAGSTSQIQFNSGSVFTANTNFVWDNINSRLGIGTSSPSAKLEIQGGSADWNETTPGTSIGTIHLDPGNITNNFGNAITFGSSDHPGNPNEGTNAQAGIYVRSDGSYGTKMYFATTNAYVDGSKTRMMIDYNGNVGIGTNSPQQVLDVVGSMRLSTGNIYRPDNAGLALQLGNSSNSHFGTHLFFNGIGNAERVRITDGGNVGIGTSSPGSKLTIGTDFASTSGITVDSANSGDSQLVLRKSANKTAFSVLAWDSATYLGSGLYYDNSSWVHHNVNANSQLLILEPGAGVNWFASNNSSAAWNVANGVRLWDDNGTLKAPIRFKNDVWIQSDDSRNRFNFGTNGTTYFGTANNYQWRSPSDTDLMLLDSVGKLGIGTTSPATPLNVVGEIRGNNFSDNFAGAYNVNLGNGNIEGRGLVAGYSGGSYGGIGYNIRHTTTGGTYISPLADTTNYIQFSQGFQFLGDAGTTAGRTTNFTELMRITNAGNVGIGTTSPTQAKLVISAPDESVSSAIAIRQSNNTIYGFDFALDQTVNGNGYLYGIDANTRYEIMQFTRDTTPDIYMVNGGGNVGIGTTSPQSKLDVNGIISIGGKAVINTTGNGANDIYGNFRVLSNDSATIQDGMYINYNSTGGANAHIRFYANGTNERMRIDANNGNVGIGTGAPSTRLQVSDNVDPVASFTNTNNSVGTAAAIRLSTASSWAVKLKTVQSTDYFQMTDDSNVIGHSWFAKRYYPGSTSNNGANTGYISGDGTNISIGKATPTTKLDVDGAICTTLGSVGTPSYSFSGDLNTGIYSPGADTIAFAEGGTEAMRINSSANVLIGTTSATTNRLSIAASTNDNLASIRLTNSFTTTGYWEIAVPGTGKNLDFLYNGSTRGYLSNATNVSNIDFTGQHRSVPENLEQLQENNIGLIVVSTGQYESFSSTNEISINEALPKVTLSTQRNQKNVFGVISDKEDGDSSTREYRVGNFINVYDKQPEDSRLIINSLGEGGIWVCNINGNLENGDYITSCEIPGYGMKQDDDLLHNYTVAKITCDCNFDLNSGVYLCEEFEFNGQIYKKAFVGCTYHCG